MNDFVNAATRQSELKLTENGALAYSTTQNSLLDLFGTIGALRTRSDNDIEQKFASAFNQDALLATKMLFYAGNIRGGLGERRTFRICLKWLAMNHADVVRKNIILIPHFNRWDSMFTLVGTPVEKLMWEIISDQMKTDIADMKAAKSISLLAKWMPSINASSPKTVALAKLAIKNLGFTSERHYRKTLSELRTYLDIVEKSMSANKWSEIQYPQVPSYAMKNYSSAFGRHDYERLNQFIESLRKGETKINAATLYPYDLVEKVMSYGSPDLRITEEQWKALPNYVEEGRNVLVLADVSGSMGLGNGRPMATSVGLAIYFAQHNKGDFANMYMTFTDRPHFITINPNDSLQRNVEKVMETDVGYSTNLEAAFMRILSTATYSQVPQGQMPEALVIVSDMEIDPYFRNPSRLDFVDEMARRFEAQGYKLPTLVMWNVEARQDTFLTQNEYVKFISGQSPSAFKSILKALTGTSWDLLLETLNDPMYDAISI